MTTWARRATDVVAYTFRAETLCPKCTHGAAAAMLHLHSTSSYAMRTTEQLLSEAAVCLRFNRNDEHSFDSGDFPKVLFDSQLVDGETCDQCGEAL